MKSSNRVRTDPFKKIEEVKRDLDDRIANGAVHLKPQRERMEEAAVGFINVAMQNMENQKRAGRPFSASVPYLPFGDHL